MMIITKRTIALIAALAAVSFSTKAATDTFSVTASSTVNYTINGTPDPDLTLVRGFTYTFNISVAALHPFYIKTAQTTGTGSQYNDGVSAQGVTSGTITFAVPVGAPDTLYYQCSSHAGMTGPLNIVDPPSINITGFDVGSNVVIRSTGADPDTLNLNVLTSSDLTNNVWTDAIIVNNVHANGTNTTQIALPSGDAAFFQVQQGFFVLVSE